MRENQKLLYRTELDLKEDFLRKVLRASSIKTWRKVYWAISGGIYLLLLGILLFSCMQTGDYSSLVFSLAVGVAVIGLSWFSTRQAIQISLRRWKEQNHEESVHVFGGFTEEGYVQAKGDSTGTLRYADIKTLSEVDGVWVMRTKAGLLVFFNAAVLNETDRKSVYELLKSRNPKIKIRLTKA